MNTFGLLNVHVEISRIFRIQWIWISAIIFFSVACLQLLILIIIRLTFKRIFCKKSMLEEDSTQHSVTEYTYPSCRTAQSNHSNIDYDLIVSPVPFILNSAKGSIIELFNGCDDRWLAVRLLTRTPNAFKIHPQKHLIPPRRKLSCRISLPESQISLEKSAKTLDNAILIEYYQLGSETPFFSCSRPWVKPYLCSRTKWRYKIVLVFYENDYSNSNRVKN